MKKTGIIFGILLLIFILVSSITSMVIYNSSFPRFERHDDTINAMVRYVDIEEEHPREIHAFLSEKNTLQGYFYQTTEPKGLIVIAHGLGGGADSYLTYTKWFLEQGYAVFSYDATGSFDSEGKSTKGFPQSLIDLKAALTYIEEHAELSNYKKVLFGHSWGGYAASNALHFDFDIKAVVSVAAPSNANAMIFEQTEKMMGLFGVTQRPFISIYQSILFGNFAKYDAIEAINQTDAHVLVIHGNEDEMIDYQKSAIIARKEEVTNPNAEFILRESEGRNGHNNLFRSTDAVTYIDQINIEYRALYDLHNQNIPYEINQDFYANIDRFRTQELDEELMQTILSFYNTAIN